MCPFTSVKPFCTFCTLCTSIIDLILYIMYIMYMNEYSVATFRINLREALDRAADGEDVFVTRHGKRYFVCSEDYYGELVNTAPKKKVPEATAPKLINTLEDVISTVLPKAQRYCNQGHPIPDGRSKCFGKGCKFS